MAETPCFFGLTTVRVGARIVAYLQFWLQFFVVLMLVIKYFSQWSGVDERISDEDETSSSSASIVKTYYGELDFDIGIFSQLSGTLLVMYASYHLKIATFTHNLTYINFWLILNSINFLTTTALIIFASYRNGMLGLFIVGIIEWSINAYTIYIVYEFYADEGLTVAVNDGQNPRVEPQRSVVL